MKKSIKHIAKILIALFVVLSVLQSCDKFLVEEPIEELNEETAFNTVDDLQAALMGAYIGIKNQAYDIIPFLNYFIDMPSQMVDDVYNLSFTSGEGVPWANWLYTPSNDFTGPVWGGGYVAIDRANIVINKADEMNLPNDADQLAQIRAEALCIRALNHFELLRFFGTSNLRNFDEANSGIPIVTKSAKSVETIEYPSRSSVKAVYDQIYSDLTTAIDVLGDVPADNQFRFDANSAKGLLARVALYARDFEVALENAVDVIDAVPDADIDNFSEIWTDEARTGVLFSVQAASGEELMREYFNSDSYRNTKAPTEALLATYDAENDVRFNSYFLEEEEENEDGEMELVTWIIKYESLRGPGIADAKILRVGEMYLIAAEASYYINGMNNGDASALGYLNSLRANRIEGVEDLTEVNIDVILEERRRELAVEGQRWYDLKIHAKGIDRGTLCEEHSKVFECTLDADDRRWIFPIPNALLLVNSNLKQSPMWE